MPIKVEKKGKEPSKRLVRRFSKKVQRSGILRTVRKKRYRQKPKSEKLKKRSALRKKQLREKYRKMRKMGEI